MPLTSFFLFRFKLHVISLNLIALIVSIETEASLLALAKSIYYFDTSFSAFHGHMQVECNNVQTVMSILSSPVLK